MDPGDEMRTVSVDIASDGDKIRVLMIARVEMDDACEPNYSIRLMESTKIKN